MNPADINAKPGLREELHAVEQRYNVRVTEVQPATTPGLPVVQSSPKLKSRAIVLQWDIPAALEDIMINAPSHSSVTCAICDSVGGIKGCFMGGHFKWCMTHHRQVALLTAHCCTEGPQCVPVKWVRVSNWTATVENAKALGKLGKRGLTEQQMAEIYSAGM